MGHLLKREERTDPDPRVENFIPDTWQVYINSIFTMHNEDMLVRETLIRVIKVMVSAPPRPFIWYQFVQAQEIF